MRWKNWVGGRYGGIGCLAAQAVEPVQQFRAQPTRQFGPRQGEHIAEPAQAHGLQGGKLAWGQAGLGQRQLCQCMLQLPAVGHCHAVVAGTGQQPRAGHTGGASQAVRMAKLAHAIAQQAGQTRPAIEQFQATAHFQRQRRR